VFREDELNRARKTIFVLRYYRPNYHHASEGARYCTIRENNSNRKVYGFLEITYLRLVGLASRDVSGLLIHGKETLWHMLRRSPLRIYAIRRSYENRHNRRSPG
jgi:hypothetical protein